MNYRGFTGIRHKIKGMQGLAPSLSQPEHTGSCDISVLHRQTHGLWETASGTAGWCCRCWEVFEADFSLWPQGRIFVLYKVLRRWVWTHWKTSVTPSAPKSHHSSRYGWVLPRSTKVSLFWGLPLLLQILINLNFHFLQNPQKLTLNCGQVAWGGAVGQDISRNLSISAACTKNQFHPC